MRALKYGLNPHQIPASLSRTDGGPLPIEVLGGRPGYINFMDALNAWQLVKELHAVTGLPAATSFKHVSPAGVGVGMPLGETLRRVYFVDDLDLSPLATAYARARGADRLCSYGDWAALSAPCDVETAKLLAREVSDGVIAPGYAPEALEILRGKRGGNYNIVQFDPGYVPAPVERRDIFGLTFEQGRNDVPITRDMFRTVVTEAKKLREHVILDMMIAQVTLKYTQSNSVCYVLDGQTIGIGAGQQSRIHCTRLAGDKADHWWLRQHPDVLALTFPADISRPVRDNAIDEYILDTMTAEAKRDWIRKLSGVTVGSDAFFPFGDNVERARRSGASYIVQPGGSIRDDHVIETCDKHGIVMAFTSVRLFHH